MESILIRTILPLILLIALGFFSRFKGIFKHGDEKIFSSYLYYFALPALFFVNMLETSFTNDTFNFVSAAILPIIGIFFMHLLLYFFFRFSRETFYLLTVSSVFGSFAFFGISFIMFAFPSSQGEHLAILSAAAISLVSVPLVIALLEIHSLKESSIPKGILQVARKLSRNPLVISIALGILFSLLGVKLPDVLSTALHMLGTTTATVSIFMLGIFLYGRKYENLGNALFISVFRMLVLPGIALFLMPFFSLAGTEAQILVLMHAMPMAISMIVLSERYNFNKDIIASQILITSIGSIIYLPLWLIFLGVS